MINSMPAHNGHPRIVAIETSGRQGSVAVAIGDDLLGMTRFAADLQHAAELLPAIHRLCETANWRPNEIDEVYVSAGPGSFTGCRIGVTVARTLAQAVGVRLICVPTVEALARNALENDPAPPHLAVLLDAQRRQAYVALFDLDGADYVQRGEILVGDPKTLLPEARKPAAVLGEGIAFHRADVEASGMAILPEMMWAARADNVLRVGRRLAELGQYVPANRLVPIYIRQPEAEVRWQERHQHASS